MVALTILRHGETVWNREKRYQGWLDSPLTEEGREQVRLRAESLRGERFGVLVSSDLGRTLESAAIAGEVLGLPIARTFMEFRESNLGILGGLTREEAMERYPGYIAPYGTFADSNATPLPGSESLDEVMLRTRRGARELLASYPSQHVLLIGHAGTQRAFCRLMGIDEPRDLMNAGVLTLSLTDSLVE